MFVLTPEGVTATDPISYGRPQAATTYTTPNNLVTAHLPPRCNLGSMAVVGAGWRSWLLF
jgi:hypothetical protein